MTKSDNIRWHSGHVNPQDRQDVTGHKGALIWFTGLSGSGKSTIAFALERALLRKKAHAYTLDGDNVRHGLCGDLGFSEKDRKENLRRISEVARLMVDAGLIVCASFVSPYERDRQAIAEKFKDVPFMMVHVATDVKACERRDPKGLYRKARRGELDGFTGVNAPYEVPESPDLRLDTTQLNTERSIDILLAELSARCIV